MVWDSSLTQLHDVLAELYDHVEDARRVATSASLPIGHIILQGKAANVWQSILEEAEKRGQVEGVINFAIFEYPEIQRLQRAADAYKQWATARGSAEGVAQGDERPGPPPWPPPLYTSGGRRIAAHEQHPVMPRAWRARAQPCPASLHHCTPSAPPCHAGHNRDCATSRFGPQHAEGERVAEDTLCGPRRLVAQSRCPSRLIGHRPER
jgi:hypothetical protein